MKFTKLFLADAFLIELEPYRDHRGHFSRTFCFNEFQQHQLITAFVQCSTAFNFNKGLIRGMHYQAAPFQETKLVRCTKGRIFDVIIDIREGSPTFQQSFGVELSDDNHKMLYIPKGFAHGYQVLENNSEIFYMMDEYYTPEAARELSPFHTNYNITWPLPALIEKNVA